ncbi:sigma-54-dependent transcriptional regulator [Oceanospirillum sediminis]|uniref:Sigma-54-dependent Fis family transcriptional regulator n=1 Tax=Oceanospirillum sediminis TaxID=2760088 RepID=A0A839IXB5_9GAMM|nr:sigma-54 dependent transcriptional regulator [Oceanospirillum sediminis]MBB1489017.1 sigma-54-dependent Fis family transcriptional regulator [Oceanospirillum sediminis]
MKGKDFSILIVEDSPALSGLYHSYLATEDFQVTVAETGSEALALLETQVFDGLLLDLQLPDMNGLEILKQIHQQQLPVASIIITAHGSVETAVETMHYGAADYLEKPFDSSRLLTTVHNALKKTQLERQLRAMQESYERNQFAGFVGGSTPMQRVYSIIESASPSKATVFITGESGTGKEVCAEAIHQLSPRKEQTFVALNCGAIPKDLMESEIFGHVKGAFTGAVSPRQGAAERADGGTLFLDEICEMDMELQVKLLRFIQTGTFQKVGSSHTQQVDVRFVCATNRDPLKEVSEGRFREDLYYRLHVIPIVLPALRERETDVTMLARHFLKLYAQEEGKSFIRFAPETEVVLSSYEWPGNIRQLQNVIRNIIVLHDGDTVTAEMLPPPLCDLNVNIHSELQTFARQVDKVWHDIEDSTATSSAVHSESGATSEVSAHSKAIADNAIDAISDNSTGILPASISAVKPLWLIEKDIIEHVVALCGGNINSAAALLEISPSTIYRKKQSWDARDNEEV